MNYYAVKFEGTPYKEYIYETSMDLPVGALCKIVANGCITYRNNVVIERKLTPQEVSRTFIGGLKTITAYQIVQNTKRPNDGIKKVIFNKEKRTTCVIWNDGVKTIIKCNPADEWDEEKALALCYMKRVLGNRSSFNETLKRHCEM